MRLLPMRKISRHSKRLALFLTFCAGYVDAYTFIVRGNTLTKRHPITEEPIRMIEWQKVPGYPSKVRAVPFAFAELFGEEVEEEKKLVMEQLSLFEWEEEVASKPEVEKVITEIEIQKVYLLGD